MGFFYIHVKPRLIYFSRKQINTVCIYTCKYIVYSIYSWFSRVPASAEYTVYCIMYIEQWWTNSGNLHVYMYSTVPSPQGKEQKLFFFIWFRVFRRNCMYVRRYYALHLTLIAVAYFPVDHQWLGVLNSTLQSVA